MSNFLISRVRVGPSSIQNAGWGVFATDSVVSGDVLEECVVFPLDNYDVLSDHRLAWTEQEDAMASGCANLYNHSDTANVRFVLDHEAKLIRIVALRDLQVGEELFKKYCCPVWW
jgi:hypothetical protein